MLVVHDLLAHVHGSPVQLERLLDGDHGTVDTGAVSTGAARRTFLSSVTRLILRKSSGRHLDTALPGTRETMSEGETAAHAMPSSDVACCLERVE
ncbi:hypothetical protein GCM10025883_25570 [Mobilicoccus caccae]|uniref:Uncharacterized protein n=1 Tax=Mobilicoccus caccae TaxID=1859295 RepID=A0ABQ6IRI2_9MICO|nr:hypothetical protein GCM10025883_25570 [Mobilicoccus caccae]